VETFKIGDRVMVDGKIALLGVIADLPVAGHDFYGVRLDIKMPGAMNLPFDQTWVVSRRLRAATVVDEIGAMARTP